MWNIVQGLPKRMRLACQGAHWPESIGLVVVALILIAVTIKAHEKVSGLDPVIRASARREAILENIELCEAGAVDVQGDSTSDPGFECFNGNASTRYVGNFSSFNERREDGVPGYASVLGVMYDCGYIVNVFSPAWLESLWVTSEYESLSVVGSCFSPGSHDVAETINDTFVPPAIPFCTINPTAAAPHKLPPHHLSTGSSGNNRWPEVCGIDRKVEAVTVNDILFPDQPHELFDYVIWRVVFHCVELPVQPSMPVSNNVTMYFTFSMSGISPEFTTACMNDHAHRLSRSFAQSVQKYPCRQSAWRRGHGDQKDYKCRQGVRTGVDNWEKWNTIYDRVKR